MKLLSDSHVELLVNKTSLLMTLSPLGFKVLHPIYGKCSKISNTKKRKNTLNLFSLLTSEAKGSKTFCKKAI